MSDERKPMTDEELAAIQGRLKNITPPPWFHVLASIVGTKDDPESPDATCVCCTEWGYCGDDPQANAAFIAHAPTDIARLLAEVERLNRVSRYLAENLVRQTSNGKKYVGAGDAWGLGFQLYKTREEAIQSWIDEANREVNNDE